MQIFKHRYINETEYNVIEITDRGTRIVDDDYPDYLKALSSKTIIEKVSGNEFVEINDNVVTIRADKDEVLLAREWATVRAIRNQLLDESDRFQMTDAPTYNNSALLTYRQELRDIPQNNSEPYNIVYPTMPNFNGDTQ